MTVLGGVWTTPRAAGAPRRHAAPAKAGSAPRAAAILRTAALPRTRAIPRSAPLARTAALPRTAALARTAALPRVGARPVAATPRRRISRAERGTARSNTVRTLVGAVLVAFLIGLIYLAQTVHLAATSYETDRLVAQRDDLYRQVQTVETSVLAWGTEPSVLERAQSLGLDFLATRIRLPAR